MNKEQQTLLFKGYESNERIIKLVNDMLNVSRIEEGRYGYSFSDCDFREVLNIVLESLENQVKDKEINCEQAFENLAEIGSCPNLLNDDNGHWAVKFDGFQNLPMGDEPEEIITTFKVVAKDWKESIYDALIWALEN